MAERNTKKTWWIVLGGLAVLIVALVVGIVVVNLNNNEEPKKSPSLELNTEAMIRLNEQAEALPVNEAKALYEEAINNAKTELERGQAQVEYGRYLIDQDLAEEGLNKLLTVDTESLSTAYEILLYAALRDYFGGIENKELFSKYNNMVGEIIKGSEYGVGF